MERKVLHRTCIACPRGCALEIAVDGGAVEVSGHACPKGEDYGIEEATDPRRILTTTVRTRNRHHPRLAVRTSASVRLPDIPRLMREVNRIVAPERVACGDVLLEDLLGTGVSVIATDEME
jgi:CxxC motif-containing protein